MKQSDIALLMKGMAPVIGELISKSVQPLVERVAELEQAISEIPAPVELDEAGIVSRATSSAAESVRPLIEDLKKALDALPALPELPDVAGMIKEALDALVAQREQDAAQVQSWMEGVDAKFSELPQPAEVKPEDFRVVIADEVSRAVGDLPKPQDGKSVTVDDVAPLIEQAVAKSVAALPTPADGVGLAGAVQDHQGHLVLTLTSGATVDVGMIAGKDVDMDAIGSQIKAHFDALPRPKDGVDGFGFDDLDLIEDEKGVVLRFGQGEVVKDFPLPVVFDRGVFKEDDDYRKGNGVTWGGSYWIAQKDDPGKPDTPDSGWRLAVKKGQNGRDLTK